jgi:hypothetical protein
MFPGGARRTLALVPSDDEFRRVAEDVRALARSLGRDLRTALDQARDDFSAASGSSRSPGLRSAREELARASRLARREFRQAQRAFRHGEANLWPDVDANGLDADELGGPASRPARCGPPRWDNWGGGRYRGGAAERSRTTAPAGWYPPRARNHAGRGRRGGRTDELSTIPVTAAPPKPPSPPLRHRHDGTTLLGLLAVVFGVAGLAAGTGAVHVSAEAVVAIALMVLGGTMVVTARTDWALSRRTWPIFGGAVLGVALVAVAVTPALPVGFRHLQFGSNTVAPSSWSAVPATVHGGAGHSVVDLTGIDGPLTAPRTLVVDNAAGKMEIDLPSSVRVIVRATVAAGDIQIDGVNTSGLRRSVEQVLNPTMPGPSLTLLLRGGFGQVLVNPAAMATPASVAPDSKVPFTTVVPPVPATVAPPSVSGPPTTTQVP